MMALDGYSKPILDINYPLDQLVDLSEKYIGTDPFIFQRSGELIHIEHGKDHKVIVKPIKSSLMRYLLSKSATWVKEDISVHPPSSIARCLVDKTSWNSIRKLTAVSSFPTISSTGEINSIEGYNSETQIYFTGEIKCRVPHRPTLHDAKQAVNLLLDIVCDFPFASPDHASAWLAALLSPLVRFAHNGNTPIVIVQANGPRVGKTNLVKVISYILNGKECPVVIHTKNEEEERKRLLSYLRFGRSMVLVDNVVGQFGGASVNAITTSRSFEDRILGQSKIIEVINNTIWFITGNNILLAPDTAERCLNIRLLSLEEKPHLRSGFKYEDLFEVILQRRTELLSAALTIIKAYIINNKPEMNLPKWGSFEPWSYLVRNALVWCGQPDPALSRQELESEADVGFEQSSTLVEGWYELEQSLQCQGLTTKEVYDKLTSDYNAPILRAALQEISGQNSLPNPHTISRHLREVRDRPFNGKRLRCIPDLKRGHKWYVEVISVENKKSHQRPNLVLV